MFKNNFDRTLILGASVSAAVDDKNPTKRFLRSRGKLNGVLLHAYGGKPASFILPKLSQSVLDRATSVIAIDLMFWDSVIGFSDPRESRAFLKGFFNAAKARSLPVIIGRVPGFHLLQIHRDELNAAIEREVENYSLAKMLKLDELFERVMSDEGVHIDGKHHRIEDLIPDGLHPGPVAAEFIAREIENLVSSTEPVSLERAEA
jgi:hypothetical protein